MEAIIEGLKESNKNLLEAEGNTDLAVMWKMEDTPKWIQ